DAVNDAEDGGIGADADGESQHRRDREARLLSQLAKRETQVTEHAPAWSKIRATVSARERVKSVTGCGTGVPSAELLVFARAQLGDGAEILERRGVAFDLAGRGQLLEQAPHDFARARFGERIGPANVVRLGERADVLADVIAQLVLELAGRLLAS